MKKFYVFAVLMVLTLSLTNLVLVAEVVYVDIDPDVVKSPPLGSSQSYSIDLNNDNHNDFYFQINNFSLEVKSIKVSGVKRGNQIAGDGDTLTDGNFLPLSLSKYDAISPSMECLWFNDWDEEWAHDLPVTIGGYGLNSEGHWTGAITEKYLAVRFITDEGYHYGWIEIQVSELFDVCTIKGYAYETEVDAPINAGDVSLGVNDVDTDVRISLYPNPAQNAIIIQNDEYSVSEIELFNALGISIQFVQNSSKNNTMSISTKDLPDGLYYCKIRGERNESVRRFVVAR